MAKLVPLFISASGFHPAASARLQLHLSILLLALPALDSFFDDRSTQDQQTAAVLKKIAGFNGSGNLVMVTHQVNITALTGRVPAQGEALVVRADRSGNLELVGRLPPP